MRAMKGNQTSFLSPQSPNLLYPQMEILVENRFDEGFLIVYLETRPTREPRNHIFKAISFCDF